MRSKGTEEEARESEVGNGISLAGRCAHRAHSVGRTNNSNL